MMEDSNCNFLCQATIPGPEDGGDVGDGAFINELIREGYNMNWLIDGLPAARSRLDTQSGESFYSVGFELGSFDEDSGYPVLNNHYDIIVEYHVPTSSRVGGFL
jgi:transmembrane 9 superfamily member 2/4